MSCRGERGNSSGGAAGEHIGGACGVFNRTVRLAFLGGSQGRGSIIVSAISGQCRTGGHYEPLSSSPSSSSSSSVISHVGFPNKKGDKQADLLGGSVSCLTQDNRLRLDYLVAVTCSYVFLFLSSLLFL